MACLKARGNFSPDPRDCHFSPNGNIWICATSICGANPSSQNCPGCEGMRLGWLHLLLPTCPLTLPLTTPLPKIHLSYLLPTSSLDRQGWHGDRDVSATAYLQVTTKVLYCIFTTTIFTTVYNTVFCYIFLHSGRTFLRFISSYKKYKL